MFDKYITVSGKSALLLLLIGLAYASAGGQGKGQQVSSSAARDTSRAWITSSKHGSTFVTENASFDYIEVLKEGGRGYNWLLSQHVDHNEWTDGQEGVRGAVTITMRSAGSANGKVLWTRRSPGNTGHPFPDLGLFQVTNSPCCSEPYKNRYFSLLTGKPLFITNGFPEKGRNGQDSGLLMVDGGSPRYSQTRFIGFGSGGNDQQSPPTIQYGTDKVIMQRLALHGREYGDNFDVPKVSLTVDGKDLTNYLEMEGEFNFTIVLQFEDGPEVRVPVENDVFRADKAILPFGYTLQAAQE